MGDRDYRWGAAICDALGDLKEDLDIFNEPYVNEPKWQPMIRKMWSPPIGYLGRFRQVAIANIHVVIQWLNLAIIFRLEKGGRSNKRTGSYYYHGNNILNSSKHFLFLVPRLRFFIDQDTVGLTRTPILTYASHRYSTRHLRGRCDHQKQRHQALNVRNGTDIQIVDKNGNWVEDNEYILIPK